MEVSNLVDRGILTVEQAERLLASRVTPESLPEGLLTGGKPYGKRLVPQSEFDIKYPEGYKPPAQEMPKPSAARAPEAKAPETMGGFSTGETVDVKFGAMTVPGGEIESFITKVDKGREIPYVKLSNGAEVPLEQISKQVQAKEFVPKTLKQRGAITPTKTPEVEKEVISEVGKMLKERVAKSTSQPSVREEGMRKSKLERLKEQRPKTKKEMRREEAYEPKEKPTSKPKAEGTISDWYMKQLETDDSFQRYIRAMKDIPKTDKERYNALRYFYSNVVTGGLSRRASLRLKSVMEKYGKIFGE
jgi:hypothetical protein